MVRDLDQLAKMKFDILVIGSGIYGACIAWDAALRGLSVALIDSGDFGHATSANSLKIIHGGLRYLQDGNPARVRQMVRERSIWLRIAPHLVRPLPCLMPTTTALMQSRQAMAATLGLNDWLSRDRNQHLAEDQYLPPGKVISKAALLQALPGLDAGTITGGALWYDAQVHNTEQLLLDLVDSAVSTGAVAANYVRATGYLPNNQRVTGVNATDMLTGEHFTINARMTINAAGVWADELNHALNVSPVKRFSPSVAFNVLTHQIIPDYAAGLRTQPHRLPQGRAKKPQMLFFVPWQDMTIIGTKHYRVDHIPADYRVPEALVAEFLDEINSAYPAAALELANIKQVLWGFLPAIPDSPNEARIRLVRDSQIHDHLAEDGIDGLLTVIGVKYTTARWTAEQAVNLALQKMNRSARPCQTQSSLLRGASIDAAEHRRVEQIGPSQNQQPFDPGRVIHAIRHQMAHNLSDVILRRTELCTAGLPEIQVLTACAALMASELSWTDTETRAQIDRVMREATWRTPLTLEQVTQIT
jgi:glycerol-3-phosphate dehydrogenase